MQSIIIKKSKEAVVRRKHPWIFSGAIERISSGIVCGEICQVLTDTGELLGFGFVNPNTDLVCRMLSYSKEFSPDNFIEKRLLAAWEERKYLVPGNASNAFRLINAEGDGLPGLVIDIYNKIAVLQISTIGMERFKEKIVSTLQKRLEIERIYEKSSSGARVLEGLEAKSMGWLLGESGKDFDKGDEVKIHEHEIYYQVPIVSGQKTGFFLDQREMRFFLRQFAENRSVLNCFAYSGGFSLNALKAGAASVVSIDSSKSACEAILVNCSNNGFDSQHNHEIICADVISFLKNTDKNFDVIVLDPPAYVKRAKDQTRGFKHYMELNKLGMSRLKKGGVLFTFSCSPFFTDEHFQKMIGHAMLASGKNMRIIANHRHALDHPVALNHSEGRYLKGCVLKEYSYA